jgi:hypothetical protein
MDWVMVACVVLYLLLAGAVLYLFIHGWLRERQRK